MTSLICSQADSAADTHYASARRSGNDEIQCQHEALTSSDLLLLLIDAIPNFVIILNKNRQIVLANKALQDFTGVPHRTKLNGWRPGELLACHHAMASPGGCGTGEACCTCGAVNAILQSLDKKNATAECRMGRVTADGKHESVDLRIWGSPFPWQGEEFALLIIADISDEKRRQLLERIFFHDVLNTAGNIRSLCEMLSLGMATGDEIKTDLNAASNALIDEIKTQRTLLNAENHQLAVNITRIHSLELLQTVAGQFQKMDINRLDPIQIAPGTDDFWFDSDPTLLSRVLGNMLKNAIEASAPHDPIVIGARTLAGQCEFWCHNPAVMPRETQLQLFQRSFSTKGSGRGIGTYSIKLLGENYLKGTVSFTSSPGHGTTFMIRLPLLAET